MGESEEIAGNVNELIGNYGDRVFRGLYPEIRDREIKPGKLTIEMDVGNPTAHHYLYTCHVDGKGYAFNARFYRAVPVLYRGSITPFEKAVKSYSFLKKAGIENVVNAITLPEAPDWLFTEHIPGGNFYELLKPGKDGKEKTREEKEKIFTILGQIVADFQHKATRAAEGLDHLQRRELLWSRSIEEQAIDFLKMFHEGDQYVDAYLELLYPILNGKIVDHGDLSPFNILGNFRIIDPELKERNEFAGLGSFFAYAGNLHDFWDKTAEEYWKRDAELYNKEKGIIHKRKFAGFDVPATKIVLDDTVKPEIYFAMRGNTLHYCNRIISKRRRFRSSDYTDQLNTVLHIVRDWKTKPGKFNLSSRKLELVDKLITLFSADSLIEIGKGINSDLAISHKQ